MAVVIFVALYKYIPFFGEQRARMGAMEGIWALRHNGHSSYIRAWPWRDWKIWDNHSIPSFLPSFVSYPRYILLLISRQKGLNFPTLVLYYQDISSYNFHESFSNLNHCTK